MPAATNSGLPTGPARKLTNSCAASCFWPTTNGAAVMEHVIKGRGNEIGFGAITEILLYEGKGLKFVGPVPAAVQNYTTYAAAPLVVGQKQEAAQEFVSFLAGPVGKPLFVAAGITEDVK